MLNASVGFQRVLGRVRRPTDHGPASDTPREARQNRRCAQAASWRPRGRRRIPPRSRPRAAHDGRRGGSGRHGESRDTRPAPSLPDLTARTRARGRDGGRGDRRRRVGHQRLAPDILPARPATPTARGRHHGSRSVAIPPATRPATPLAIATGGGADGTAVTDGSDATVGTDTGTGDAALGAKDGLDTTDSTGSVEFGQPVVVTHAEIAVRRHRFRRHGDLRDRRSHRRGPVHRRRHAGQADRRRHDRRRRQRPGPDLQGQGRRHARRHRHEVRASRR